MQLDAIYLALTRIFRDCFEDESLELRPELLVEDIHGWDSYRNVEILMAVQDRFGVKLTSREIDSVRSIDDLAGVLERHQVR